MLCFPVICCLFLLIQFGPFVVNLGIGADMKPSLSYSFCSYSFSLPVKCLCYVMSDVQISFRVVSCLMFQSLLVDWVLDV
jgi:hypothetical protein